MIIEAILRINPNAKVSVFNEDINQITWLEETPEIPKADIEAKVVELQAEYVTNEYQRSRATEYPAWQDQLDDIFHNGIDGWKATIQVTKDKYPKG